jgi:hypothetical protein
VAEPVAVPVRLVAWKIAPLLCGPPRIVATMSALVDTLPFCA